LTPLRFIFEVERGIQDLTGDGEFWTVEVCLVTVSGVKLTCFTLFERPSPTGVVGADGRALSRFGLLALRVKGVDKDIAGAPFFELALGCLSMDLIRSSLFGERRKPLDSDLVRLETLLVVADFVNPPGVPPRLGFDGDLDNVGIWVLGCLTLVARPKDA